MTGEIGERYSLLASLLADRTKSPAVQRSDRRCRQLVEHGKMNLRLARLLAGAKICAFEQQNADHLVAGKGLLGFINPCCSANRFTGLL